VGDGKPFGRRARRVGDYLKKRSRGGEQIIQTGKACRHFTKEDPDKLGI
jgi:hypothetical protein